MALTDSEQRQLILRQLRLFEEDADLQASLEAQVRALWELYADQATLHPRLRYYLVLRDAAEWVLHSPELVSWKEADASEDWKEALERLAALLKRWDASILALQAQLGGNRGPVGGELTRKAPIQVDDREDLSLYPDPNSRRYRGDPYYLP